MLMRMASEEKITFTPVGTVKTDAVGNQVRDENVISNLVIKPEFTEALEGIEDFSHIFVLFYLNLAKTSSDLPLKVHPRGRIDMPLVGLFGTRTPYRPNPIGLTVVKLLKIEGNVLTVKGLDAYDGTPVLDVKPYDSWDCKKDAKVADWWKKLNPNL